MAEGYPRLGGFQICKNIAEERKIASRLLKGASLISGDKWISDMNIMSFTNHNNHSSFRVIVPQISMINSRGFTKQN